MKFGVVQFPGSNCDDDAYHAIGSVIGEPVEFIWHQSQQVSGFDAIILPGGFGAAKNLCDFAMKGAAATVHPEVVRLLKEMVVAKKPIGAICIAPVVLAEPTRVVFQRDLNGNGVVDPTRERVTYLLRPGETILRRDAGGGAQPVVEGVRGFRLTYLDRAGTPATDPAAVTAVRIRLEIGGDGAGVVMETQATLRNLLW